MMGFVSVLGKCTSPRIPNPSCYTKALGGLAPISISITFQAGYSIFGANIMQKNGDYYDL